jgi:histidyl-tRNA synthetase
MYKESPKMPAQLRHASDSGIPFAVIFGGNELAKGVVLLKDLEKQQQVEVPRADLPKILIEKIAAYEAARQH